MPEASSRGATPAVELVLAFDYGARRIGLAVGDSVTRTARPLAAVGNAPQAVGPALAAISREITGLRPARLVVGCPYNADGSPSALTRRAREFAAQLQQRFELPVVLVDERHSSQEAAARLREQRASGQRNRRVADDVDSAAAAIILERWFAGETVAATAGTSTR
jgi:putative Holliday junction resolvase